VSFPSSTLSRLAARHTKTTYTGHQRLLSWRKHGKGIKLTTHFHLKPKLRILDLHFHFPLHIHGIGTQSTTTKNNFT
jgi:hypothetical protein